MSRFGGSNASDELISFIRSKVSPGGFILEFGSGDGSTRELCDDYNLFSIEHNHEYLWRYKTNYIHATFVNGWYNPVDIRRYMSYNSVNFPFDLFLVDGPIGGENRLNMLKEEHIGLFDFSGAWVVCDDTHRKNDLDLFNGLASRFDHTDYVLFDHFGAFKVR